MANPYVMPHPDAVSNSMPSRRVHQLEPRRIGVQSWTCFDVYLKFITRNDLHGFGEQGFIRSIDDRSRLIFDYRGIYRDVINSVTPTDVRWTCQLPSRLSERQWRAAFRAEQYDEEHATRYISKIKQKIAQACR